MCCGEEGRRRQRRRINAQEAQSLPWRRINAQEAQSLPSCAAEDAQDPCSCVVSELKLRLVDNYVEHHLKESWSATDDHFRLLGLPPYDSNQG
jgi:hypothetical protein